MYMFFYTKLPHSKQLKVLHNSANFCLYDGSYKYIGVNNFEFWTLWISKPDSYFVVFHKYSFKKPVKYGWDNLFLKVGWKMF